ncbi:MAG: hypothetical protein P4N60_06500 [Verrucomicrobiae bacterium]|nr:hypothetical protein [Verrucomicrobiae bacterium]
MIRRLLISLIFGTGLMAGAAPLQFTNLTLPFFPTLTNQLNAVTYDGGSNFLAAGDKKMTVRGHFMPGKSFLTNADWSTTIVSLWPGTNLSATAASSNLFIVSGENNAIVSSPDGLTWTGGNSNVFVNSALAVGAANNAGIFVVAGAAPEIGWTAQPLPKTTAWNLATITNLSFAESFRGVAKFGSGGFVSCGVFGVVRLSTNAGAFWQPAIHGSIGQPDLFGVAGDGQQTIVAVGASNATTTINGVILSTTNRGATWNTYLNPLANSPINAVAYTGSGYVAAGKGGQVYVSSNGVAWSPVAVTWNNTVASNLLDLYGVAFATSGYLNQVGELVGTNGNVILCGYAPPAPVSLGNTLTCVGTTTPLVVSTTNSVGTNLVTVDWYDAPAGGTLIIADTVSFTPPIKTSNLNTTNHYWAETRDLRTSFVSTNRTEMIWTNMMRPIATMVTTNTICNGDSTILTNYLAGNAPFTNVWLDNNNVTYTQIVNITGLWPTNNPYTNTFAIPSLVCPYVPTNVFPNAATNHAYWIIKVSDAFFPADDAGNTPGTNWFGDLTGTNLVRVNPRPTSTAVTTNTICNGDSTALKNVLTGFGPWTVYWTDGFTSFAQTVNVPGPGPYTNSLTIPNGVFNPTNVFLNAPTNHYYWVTFLTDSNNCGSRPEDIRGTNWVKVNPRPTSTSVTTNTICNGDPTVLTNVLTGFGPWTVYWTDGFTNFTQTVNGPGTGPYVNTLAIPNSAFNPTNVLLNAPTNHFYWVTLVTDSNCVSQARDIIGMNRVTVNPRPTSRSVTTNTICNGDSTILTNVLTGLGPWTVYWTDGFTNYTQTVNGNGAGPFTNKWVIANVGGNPFNPTNVFPNAPTNHFYWVTLVTDTNCVSETRDITGTNWVRVNPRPTSTSVTTNTICNGDVTVLQNVLTGFGPWTVYWTDGLTNFTQTVSTTGAGPYTNSLTIPNGVFDPTDVFLNAPTNHYYWVTFLTDSNSCGSRAQDITGTNWIKVNPRPTSTSVTTNTICNGDPTVLKNVLTGFGPWTVYWTDGFTNFTQTVNVPGTGPYLNTLAIPNVGGNPFNPTNVFLNAATNHYYWVTLVTDSNCVSQAQDITGTNVVTVNPRPTATLMTSNTICNGDTTALVVGLTGLGPWTVYWTDGFTNFTQTVSVNAGGPFIDILAIPNGVFNPANVILNAATNHYYWVTLVTDSNCVSHAQDITGTNVVTVNPRPASTLWAFNVTNCDDGTTYTLTNVLTGIGPWTNLWSLNGQSYTQVVGSAVSGPFTNTLLVYPTNSFRGNAPSNYVYYVTGLLNANTCGGSQPGDLSGIVSVTVNPRPTSVLWSFNTTNCNTGTSYVLTNVLTGIGPWTNVWSLDGQPFTQVAGGAGPGPFTNILQVHPTNSLGATVASNNVYYLTAVINADTCSGNLPGDLVGVVTNVINPAPLAPTGPAPVTNALTSPLQVNPTLTVSTANSAFITAGAVTVDWYLDAAGTIPAYTATNSSDVNWLTGGGVIPAVNTLTFIPTNRICGAYTYWARARVVDANCSCLDCVSTNLTRVLFVVIPPIPTGGTGGANCALNGQFFGCPNPVLSVTLLTNFDYPPHFLTADWFDADGNMKVNGSLAYTPTNAAAGTYLYFVETRDVVTGQLSINRLPVVFKVDALPLASSAQAPVVTNVLTAPYQTNGSLVVSVDNSTNIVATNTPGATVTVDWFLDAGATIPAYTATNPADPLWLTGGGVIPATNTLTFIPTNRVSGTYVYYARARVINPGFNGCTCVSTNLTAVVFLLIPPAPASLGDQTNNVLVPNPALAVTVLTNFDHPPRGLTANWYDNMGNLKTAGSLTCTPADGAAGSYTYYVEAMDILTGYVSTNRTAVTFTLVTNPPCLVTYQTNTYPVVSNLITFDDLPSDSVINAYAGFNWSNFTALDGTDYSDPSGYQAGVVSPKGIAYGQDGVTSTIASTTPFDLVSAYLTAAWYDNLQLQVVGYDTNGVLVYSNVFVLSPTTPTNIIFNYLNVTQVSFVSSGGTPHPGYGSVGAQYIMDNLVVSNGVEVATNVDCSAIPEAPVLAVSQTNCAGVMNDQSQLAVTVSGGQTVNWYDASTNLLARGVNPFTPTNTAPGVYTEYAQAVDTGTYYVSPNFTPVTLTLLDCLTNPPVISLVGGSNINVSWFGDLKLQSTTNLAPPVIWVDVFTNPVVGPTNLSWPGGTPPVEFFRLQIP